MEYKIDWKEKHFSTPERERRFIELLGYTLINVDECNWNIHDDESDKDIGTFYCNGEEYHTVISSSKVNYEDRGKCVNAAETNKVYEYEVNGKFGHKYKVYHTLSEVTPFWHGKLIRIESDDLVLEVRLEYDIQLQSKIEFKYGDTKVTKIVDYHPMEYIAAEYLDDESRKINQAAFFSAKYEIGRNSLDDLSIHTIIRDGENADCNISVVKTDMNDWIMSHHRGIEIFEVIRNVINNIIPFKEDVIRTIFTPEGIKDYQLEIFFPEHKEEKESTSCL